MRPISLAALTLLVAMPLAAQVAKRDTTAKQDTTARRDTTAAQVPDTGPLSLVREQFSYEGGSRDPFVSLLKSGDVRPLISDLKLVGIYYDERYTARSVAVLRDITTAKRYRVRISDVLGRLKVAQIRPRDVVFTVQEFGYERQETLSLAKQEVTP
ncbi:MAG TPA: hypothetical protein VMH88_13470 [Gemmatimonadales bacterium]|nr:hypothetical protein [Gemmatimonadales bacterium]